MDYKYVENLVRGCKEGHELSKEDLANEFKPMILNLSKRTFIDGYEMYDIQNECYKMLFKCVSFYNADTHRFVAYATNAIKNEVNYLIRKSKIRSASEGNEALTLSDNLEHYLESDEPSLDDKICSFYEKKNLNSAIKKLKPDEQELVNFIFIQNNSVKKYAETKNMGYSTARYRRTSTLKKLGLLVNSSANEFKDLKPENKYLN